MEMLKTLKEKIMGTDEQNKAASERMKNNPMEKKFQKMMGNEPKDEKEAKPVEKAKGGKVKKYAEGGDVFSKAEPYLKKAVEKTDKSLGITKEPSPELRKSFAEKLEKLSKSSGGGSGGGGGIPKLNRDLTKNMKSGGKVTSASKRADGCAIRGKTRA
jgi:hypothetical protein